MSMDGLCSYKNCGLFDGDVFVVVSEVSKGNVAVEFVVVRAFFEDFIVDSFSKGSCDFEDFSVGVLFWSHSLVDNWSHGLLFQIAFYNVGVYLIGYA